MRRAVLQIGGTLGGYAADPQGEGAWGLPPEHADMTAWQASSLRRHGLGRKPPATTSPPPPTTYPARHCRPPPAVLLAVVAFLAVILLRHVPPIGETQPGCIPTQPGPARR